MSATDFQGIKLRGDPVTPTQRPRKRAKLLTETVWRFENGRMATGRVGCTLPRDDVYFRAGPVAASSVQALPLGCEIITRIVPWVTVFAGPDLWSTREDDGNREWPAWRLADDGQLHFSHRGLACWDDGLVFVTLRDRACDFLSTCVHEAYHMVSRELSEGARATIDRATAGGLTRGSPWLDDPEERRARLFEHWCMTIIEGAPPRPAANALDDLFQRIWSGEVGTAIIRREAA